MFLWELLMHLNVLLVIILPGHLPDPPPPQAVKRVYKLLVAVLSTTVREIVLSLLHPMFLWELLMHLNVLLVVILNGHLQDPRPPQAVKRVYKLLVAVLPTTVREIVHSLLLPMFLWELLMHLNVLLVVIHRGPTVFL